MKASEQVKALEDELAKYKGAVRGNCVLRNREGFEKPMVLDSSFLIGSEAMYGGQYPPMRHISLWERRSREYPHRSGWDNRDGQTNKVTYLNTGYKDEFDRVVLEEVL